MPACEKPRVSRGDGFFVGGEKNDERDFHEGKAGIPAHTVDVPSNGVVDAGQLAVQHSGQLLCSPNK